MALEELRTAVNNHNALLTSSAYIEAVNIYTAAKDRYFRAIEKYDEAIPAEVRPYKAIYEDALKAVEAAKEDLQYAYDSLYAAQESNSQSAAVSYIDLQQKAEEIRLQQEKIKSLAGDEENVITANVSGVVDSSSFWASSSCLFAKIAAL